MTISVTGTATMTPATATSWAIPLPAAPNGPAVGRTTLVCYAGATTDVSARTFPSGWQEGVLTASASSGVLVGMAERVSYGWADNLDAGNQPGDTVTITTANATSQKRSGISATIAGGYVRSVGRCNTASAIANGGTATLTSGTALTGNKNGLGNLTTTTFASSGDKVLIFLCSNRHNSPPTVNAGGALGLTNPTLVATHQGDAAGNVCLTVWTADVGTGPYTSQIPTISVTDNAGDGQTLSANAFVYVISPNVENAQEGAGGDRIRISVIGDSITHGSAFNGNKCDGESVGESAVRWIDRLFGVQATAVNTTLNFGVDQTVKADIGTAAAITWYNGTYTPYDGAPTTNVRVRNMGQAGFNAAEHIRDHRSGNIANREDSGESADILIINLGANDEREGRTAAQFRDDLVHLATVFNPAPYVVLVKQWAWAFDFGDTWNRAPGQTHDLFLTAIDDAKTLIEASGRTCVVVSTASSATASGGTNVATADNANVFGGVTGPSGTVDNIHPSQTAQDTVWRATIQTGLDQLTLLNPAPVITVSRGNPNTPGVRFRRRRGRARRSR